MARITADPVDRAQATAPDMDRVMGPTTEGVAALGIRPTTADPVAMGQTTVVVTVATAPTTTGPVRGLAAATVATPRAQLLAAMARTGGLRPVETAWPTLSRCLGAWPPAKPQSRPCRAATLSRPKRTPRGHPSTACRRGRNPRASPTSRLGPKRRNRTLRTQR